MAKKKDYKVVIHTCITCNYEWLSKKEEYVCPECKSVYLEEEKR